MYTAYFYVDDVPQSGGSYKDIFGNWRTANVITSVTYVASIDAILMVFS